LRCFLGNRLSKWLTDCERLLILMRIILLILAFVEFKKRTFRCNFYNDMYAFVNLANDYLSKYETLTEAEKKSYQNRLHAILKKLSENRTYIIGGTWGQSWTLLQLYSFYQVVISDLNQDNFPGPTARLYCLPEFSCSRSRDPLIREEINRKLFGIDFCLPQKMYQEYPVIFKSDTPALNDPPPVVSKPFENHYATPTLIALMNASIEVKSLATPRESVRSPQESHDHTQVASTSREICTSSVPCTPLTSKSARFSKWLLQALLSQEFLQFLQQQSQQSSSQQLKRMFAVMRMFLTQYEVELLYHQNPATIHSFFQALDQYKFVKIALELYREKPLDGWMDIRIVSESNEEDQKQFFKYLEMMIRLEVWLCDDDVGKQEFSAECDGKLWRFDESNDSFYIFNLPEPSTTGKLPPIA